MGTTGGGNGPRRGLADSFLYPCQEPLPDNVPINSIALTVLSVDSWLYGGTWRVVWFLIYSITVALIFKPYLKVNF
ncbi:MAG: hypothetical protein KKC18_10330 [Chloroflexi bacterium]|nr:hypothetical protein [Chloroflexota bacterium]